MLVRYDFTCGEHVFEVIERSGNTEERPCIYCSKPAHWKPSFQRMPEFKPFWHEHITPERPVLIESRKHYAEVCRQYGLYGPYNEAERAKNRSQV